MLVVGINPTVPNTAPAKPGGRLGVKASAMLCRLLKLLKKFAGKSKVKLGVVEATRRPNLTTLRLAGSLKSTPNSLRAIRISQTRCGAAE